MKRILFLGITAIMIIVSCGGGAIRTDGGGSSVIAGVVVDSASQLPIDSVSGSLIDTIRNPSFSTDSLGEFEYIIWGVGVKKVFFRKQGYFTLSQIIDFGTNPKNLKIELVKQ